MSWASWGNNIRLQQAQARTRRIFNHYHQRNVCWRSRDDIMFVYCILSILLAQYTREFLFISINQMIGVNKKDEEYIVNSIQVYSINHTGAQYAYRLYVRYTVHNCTMFIHLHWSLNSLLKFKIQLTITFSCTLSISLASTTLPRLGRKGEKKECPNHFVNHPLIVENQPKEPLK